MRKHAFLLLCFYLSVASSFAQYSHQESYYITFDEDHSSAVIYQDHYNITVTKEQVDLYGNATVSFSIFNNEGIKSLYVFKSTFSKKELRKDYRIVVKDDEIEQMLRNYDCQLAEHNYQVPPLRQVNLNNIQIQEDSEATVVLPIYVAKKKSWPSKKMLITDGKLWLINIKVEAKPDPDYPQLSSECDSLIDAISQQTFCRHRLHQPKLDEQEEPFLTEIRELQRAVNFKLNQTPRQNKYYNLYLELKNRLDQIDLTDYEVDDCGNPNAHLKVGNSHKHCQFCDMSLEEIWQYLDNLYQRVDTEQTDKKAAISEVNMILNCCKNSTRHASEWRSGTSKYKKAIEQKCNAIKNYH